MDQRYIFVALVILVIGAVGASQFYSSGTEETGNVTKISFVGDGIITANTPSPEISSGDSVEFINDAEYGVVVSFESNLEGFTLSQGESNTVTLTDTTVYDAKFVDQSGGMSGQITVQ